MPICSECPKQVSGRAKTCGDACRSKRHRRIKRGRAEGTDPHSRLDLPSSEIEAAINRTVDEALAPVVREALTEDVLRSIGELVKLTPKAVEAIAQDLSSENDFIRQGAYRLLARYTLGHPALVPDMDSDKQVVVLVNGVARPGGAPQPSETVAPTPDAVGDAAEPVDLRECDTCHEHKPEKEFVGASHRCTECFTRARDHAYSITERS